jgi:RHS repeat-associated protein
MNARYQDPVRGQFISEDPLVNGLSSGAKLLMDPQQLNFYSYGRDNPVRYTDPSGDYTAAQNAAIANVVATFGVTNPTAAQRTATGNLALSFGVAAPVITNLAGNSYGSTPSHQNPAAAMHRGPVSIFTLHLRRRKWKQSLGLNQRSKQWEIRSIRVGCYRYSSFNQ